MRELEAGEAYAKLTEELRVAEANYREVKQDNRDLVEQSWQNAERANKAEAKLAEAEDDAATAQAELRAVTAERDELAATVERVREATAIWGDGQFRAAVRAALYPKPAFVLPTEAGARFEATDNLGHEVTFRAVWSGPHIMYLNESTSVIWNCDDLLAGCTDFRLLDGADEDGGDE